MKVLVTGVTGQLGYDAARELVRRGHTVTGSGRRTAGIPDGGVSTGGAAADGKTAADGGAVLTGGALDGIPFLGLDITDRDAVREAVAAVKPDALLHCAAWTDVDGAEEPENRDRVFAVNEQGTAYLAEAAKAVDAKMVYISTDYVFDGHGQRPWRPDDACFAPLNVYGQSKLAGERAVARILRRYFIVRVSWVFGIHGNNFIKTMIRVGKTHDTVRVVHDQIGTPTYTRDLARLLADMAESEKFGCYHASNEGGYISWYDFCREIYRQVGLSTAVVPVTTEEYGLRRAARPQAAQPQAARPQAARPRNSRLDKRILAENGFAPLPDWRDALGRYLQEADLQAVSANDIDGANPPTTAGAERAKPKSNG